MADVEVYWAARDLAGSPFGNHHFILIMLPENYSMQQIKTQTEGSQRFVTLGGFAESGNLVFKSNDSSDVQSVKEVLNPSLRSWYTADYDMERNKITPPTGGGWNFATTLERLAFNYEKNTKTSPVPYSLKNENCAAWVNTILKVAGVSAGERIRLGEFSGIDWGEEDEIPESLFK